MLLGRPSLPTLTVASFLSCLLLAGPSTPAQAGCGCDKPPPEPAAVVPNAAFPGMTVTLFSANFLPEQPWTVRFRSGTTTTTVIAIVQLKRDLTARSQGQFTPQLVVTVPNVPLGPTRIEAFTPTASLTVLEDAFTVIGTPLTIAERTTSFTVANHKTAVGADGVLYLAVNGLDGVCRAMSFGGQFTEYPLRFGIGDIVIRNSQGFLIDLLDSAAADHCAALPGGEGRSNELYYFRHSFQQYCVAHKEGHSKEVDPTDRNWHKDGTPHTDYSTLIFAIAGHLPNGQPPAPGPVVSDVIVTTSLGSGTQAWERESNEEGDDRGGRRRHDDGRRQRRLK